MKRMFIFYISVATTVAAVIALSGKAITISSAPETPNKNNYRDNNPVRVPFQEDREAFYGDLHLHTIYSFDAYIMGSQITPDSAYRFARGEPVQYMGSKIRRYRPLDFLAVTDHIENLAPLSEMENPDSPVARTKLAQRLQEALRPLTAQDGSRRFVEGWPPAANPFIQDTLNGRNMFPGSITKSAWQREIDSANRNYIPGKFTTFIAYEWGSNGPGTGGNWKGLHRNVIFKGDKAPHPFSSIDSWRPEDLWSWLNERRKEGYEALAIPHNSNASKGAMFDNLDSEGRSIDADYASNRSFNEPLSELGQVKGTSETNRVLSPADEFAGFEVIADINEPGSFVRSGLGRGLILRREIGLNPFQLGFVGGSDFHSGLSVSDEKDYGGNYGMANLGGGKVNKPQLSEIFNSPIHGLARRTSSGYLTGVWAESNTRQSIFTALRRKETFATSGPRLKFRFFAAWGLSRSLFKHEDWVKIAYKQGVPMGGELRGRSKGAPDFVLWAVKDPDGANLDRVQVIKVWEEHGKYREKIFDVLLSNGRKVDVKTGQAPPVGSTVDLSTGRYTNSVGATELKAVWRDPEFDANTLAVYYMRVLEIPTPRWTTIRSIEMGIPLPSDVPALIQERGWSSPIWITPVSRSPRGWRTTTTNGRIQR